MCIRDRYQRRVRDKARANMALLCKLLCALCVVAVMSHELEVQEIQGSTDVSLVEISESSRMDQGAEATAELSADEAEQFKAKFMSIAASIKTPTIRSDVMLAERMATTALNQGRSKETGDGLDLIFRKLQELEGEIKTEQHDELQKITQKRDKANAELEEANNFINDVMNRRKQNTELNKASLVAIQNHRAAWKASRGLEDETHRAVVTLQANREEESEVIRAEVDERNKAIDVLVKALFMVCERFNRFKNTALCVSIKSQPDIQEPDRYETKEPDEAKAETELTHDKETPFAEAWELQKERDYKKEGALCPETPDSCPAEDEAQGGMDVQKGRTFNVEVDYYDGDVADVTTENACAAECNKLDKCNAFLFVKKSEQCKMTSSTLMSENTAEDECCVVGFKGNPNEEELVQDSLLQLAEDQHVQADSRADIAQINKLTKIRLPPKYAIPLKELVLVATGTSSPRKRKNIVQIIIQVVDEIRLEQATAKSAHQDKLDGWYDQSWTLKASLDAQAAEQARLWTEWQQERADIEERIVESEGLRQDQERRMAARVMIEDGLAEDERAYGIDESLRLEDLENLVKLRSLLRALYDSTKPQGCPRTAGVLCTDKVAGWCVFSEQTPSKKQRCSCNVGFYGDACQYRMCPGNGDVLYTHDAEGVCSDRGTGQVGGRGCDNSVGKCTCDPDYYHGPANKCEYRHAPASKYESDGADYLKGVGVVDDKCSDRSVSLDKKRGICHCDNKFWGHAPNPQQPAGACETRKCPNSNGVLYPHVSANACNGHGACVPESGKCECESPYFGVSCEFTNCPHDCGGKGTCNTQTGKCACQQSPIAFNGPSCEFRTCPAGCNSPNGECNRNDGKCICKMGYTGEECQLSTRCPATSLNTKETNWYTLWDKPGWVSCPKGQLLYALKAGKCDALSCVDSGSCAAGCQGDSFVYQTRHCYHDLGWYNSFDTPGWSKCLPDYYVAGLYRSCESLYCLQMAKCCSMKQARWAQCGNCLLYTSDAADEEDSGDLGGRRIIKKKKTRHDTHLYGRKSER
eukprot:TRINITY_DN3647_c0_g1_i2.p1 TRINITY_DN3647_c0_g1~~TRINITY_DN3647_c0_g1_i2.p1  ORF type:complete len:1038 (+),score=285.07 TRINITY_DN3647_c0_g1_i2:127-3240(+)